MAVNPELQKLCEEKILTANISLITNVRMDHIKDMGDTLEDLAIALSNTTPSNGKLIVNDSEFNTLFTSKANKKNSQLIVAKPYEDVFKYEMPNEMAKSYLKERKGSDVKMDANDFLCKVVNDNFGLKGRCVKVIRR
jgi:folylpolyglutamate synthase/dihydropteroate synthase